MTDTPASKEQGIGRLLRIIELLRHPDKGSPWMREKTPRTILSYTIEEAYELADAVERGDTEAFKDELADLLFQVTLHSRMAEEQGHFDFNDVAHALSDKLERRLPHIFGRMVLEEGQTEAEVWQNIKEGERSDLAQTAGRVLGALDDIAGNLPAIRRAETLQMRASRVGFDWPDHKPVLQKLREEISELSAEIELHENQKAIEDELGDVLFAILNLARHIDIDPERALAHANSKFEYRFRYMEDALREEGLKVEDQSLDVLDALWEEAKETELDL